METVRSSELQRGRFRTRARLVARSRRNLGCIGRAARRITETAEPAQPNTWTRRAGPSRTASQKETENAREQTAAPSWVSAWTSLEARSLECAACLDTLVARRRIVPSEAEEGKQLLERIVSMLWRMIESQPSHPDHGTKSVRARWRVRVRVRARARARARVRARELPCRSVIADVRMVSLVSGHRLCVRRIVSCNHSTPLRCDVPAS
jgi:hypothetical protein